MANLGEIGFVSSASWHRKIDLTQILLALETESFLKKVPDDSTQSLARN